MLAAGAIVASGVIGIEQPYRDGVEHLGDYGKLGLCVTVLSGLVATLLVPAFWSF